jgi:hypothetical protein
MVHNAILQAVLEGRTVTVVVTGGEVDVGIFKANIRRIHGGVAFGVIKGVSNGVIEQKITIPPSGVEGIRNQLMSLLSQSSLDIKPFEPEPAHETHDSPK